MSDSPTLILGIETSCDETSASVVENGNVIRSLVIASQALTHATTGGVVPEIAAREHVAKINSVIALALDKAGVTFNNLTAIAVANRPGLMGALLVGVSAAKAIAYAVDKPLLGIHHIEAHIYANFLTSNQITLPAICLVASGGHSEIFLVKDHGVYEILGRTRDDAAGEAFDKSARVLGLGYPGGEKIDKLAHTGNPKAIHLPRAWLASDSLDFSFSGLKTAVINGVKTNPTISTEDWAASIQTAIVDVLVTKTINAAKLTGVSQIMAAGGVAANSGLQNALRQACINHGFKLSIPEPKLCTDNAAMIACTGHYHYSNGKIDNLELDTLASDRLA
jgi:N6-L-threonylcarbamoyladenine synthase